MLTSGPEIGALAERIRRAGPDAYLAWDTESGATEEMRAIFPKAELHPYVSAYLTGISLCLVPGPGGDPADFQGYYVPVGHQRGNALRTPLRGLCRAMSGTAATQVTHHCLFDWAVLEQAGLGYRPPDGSGRRRGPHLDTQVIAWHQDENRVKGLKTLGEMYLDEDAAEEQTALNEARASVYPGQNEAYRAVRAAYPELPVPLARVWARELRRSRSWGQLTVSEIAPYAGRDATLTAELAEHLLQAHPTTTCLSKGQRREMAYQGVLHRMVKRGVSVSVEELDAAADLYLARAEALQLKLQHEHGISNPASSKQTAQLLYRQLGLPVMGRTKTGAAATDKNALEMLQGHPVARDVLEYRKWKHAADSYATTFANHARYSADGRIHGHYSSTQTVTGRLSASGPNVMTIPRDDSLPEIRHAFYTTPPGITRIGFDLSSAELWVTASVTKDPLLTTTLQEGRNLHVETMLAVFGGEPDKERREYTLSKNVNFGIEYGAGLDQITIFAAKAGYSPREARRVAKQMRDGHKQAYATQHRMAKFLADYADKHGVIPMYGSNDRYRHFWSPGKRVRSYTALNALVQGGVAEFMKDTMLELDHTWLGKFLVLQVHDELAFDVPDEPGIADRAHRLLQRIARDINPFRYPLSWAAKQWREDDGSE